MFKYKPFLICVILLTVSAAIFASSFIVEAVIDSKFNSMASALAKIEFKENKAFALYAYDGEEYRIEIPQSSAISENTLLPIYFETSSPQNAMIKNLTPVYLLRYTPILFILPFTLGTLISAGVYKKRQIK